MSDTMMIELLNGESVRLTTRDSTAVGELVREGQVVASGNFASHEAMRRWASAMIARNVKSNARAICLNCGD